LIILWVGMIVPWPIDQVGSLSQSAQNWPRHHSPAIADSPTRSHNLSSGSGLPELERQASTVSTWRPQILAFLLTGVTNAGSEATNRVIKTVARDAYGFRNPKTSACAPAAPPPRSPRIPQTPLNFEEP
jgi:hypothetical protein